MTPAEREDSGLYAEINALMNLSSLNKRREGANVKTQCAYTAAKANTYAEIEEICGGLDFGAYVNNLVAEKEFLNLEELDYPVEILNDCAIQLLKPTLKSTLVHEFGHNLGLTHNFMGSTDFKNFELDENGVPVARSTSVMDYPERDSDRGFKPGTYEVAAIHYAYYRTVELKETNAEGKAKIVSIASNDPEDTRPIEDRVEDPSALRNYSYCWDLDILDGEIPIEDPRCRRWDRGANPVQMVYALMDRFNALTTTEMDRYEGDGLYLRAPFALNQVMMPMKSIYTRYRYLLYLKTKDSEDPYFVKGESNFDNLIAENVGSTQLSDAVMRDTVALEKALTERDASGNLVISELEQYRVASDVIFKFLTQVAFAEDRYCTAWKAGIFVGAAPFAKLRLATYNASVARGGDRQATLQTCDEIAATLKTLPNNDASLRDLAYFSDSSAVDTIKQFGKAYDIVTYTANEEGLQDKAPVTLDFGSFRIAAMETLTSRMAPLGIANANGFTPSFLDNPNYRAELLNLFGERLSRGVNPEKMGAAPGTVGNLIEFSEEQDLLRTMFILIQNNLVPPGDSSDRRRDDIRPIIANAADFQTATAGLDLENDVAVYQAPGGVYVYSLRKGSPIWSIIKKFRTLEPVLEGVSIAETAKEDRIAFAAEVLDLATQLIPAFSTPATEDTPASIDSAAAKLAVDLINGIASNVFKEPTAEPLVLEGADEQIQQLYNAIIASLRADVQNQDFPSYGTIIDTVLTIPGLFPSYGGQIYLQNFTDTYSRTIYVNALALVAAKGLELTSLTPALASEELALSLQAMETLLPEGRVLSELSVQEELLRTIILSR